MGRLFWKFFFSFWLTLILATVSVGSLVWLKRAAFDDTEVMEPAIKFIDYRAAPFVDVAARIAEYNGTDALKRFLKQLEKSPMPSVLAIDDDDQDILGREVNLSALQQARERYRNKRKVIQQVSTEDGNLILFATLPSSHKHASGKPPGGLNKERPLLLIIIAGLVASLSFSALLAWYFTRPVRTLKAAFQSLAQGKLDTRVSEKMGNRRDEIGELGHHFDVMADQIAHLLGSQRQLLHDVSHELRSPLARMQAAIGLAEQQPEKLPATLTRIERETNRMSNLVGELLLLSRLEAGIQPTQQMLVDLGQLMDEIVEDAQFEASQKTIRIDYHRDADLMLNGHQELLHRAIENVIRNAIKYSQAKDVINIHAQRNTYSIDIIVTDQGPGINDADMAKLFKPFFRAGNSLTQDGYGLGLTIAQRAVLAHRGEIFAANQTPVGLKLTISLPTKHLTN